MLGFPVARSTLCRAMQRLAACQAHRDALVEALRASPVVYADETGWKQGGRRVWLWVFTNLRETVYEILPGRGFEQAASVLGKNYAGTLGVDGWAPYRCFKEATLQTCYNHLLHRCHELLETATRGAVRFPRLVKAILRHALALRDRRDAGEISPHGLRVAKGLLQAKMNRLLHGRFTNLANQRFAKHLRRSSGQPLCVPRPCGRRGHQLSRRTRHSHRRGQPQDLRRRQPYRERGTGPVDPHERPPELPSQRDPRDRHRHVNVLPTTPPGQPRAVVLPDGMRVSTEEGTPQGGPLSPLLSNVVLDELDWQLSRRGLRFVRYADDCNIYVGSERAGRRVMDSVRRFLEGHLRLLVNEDKSAVARPEERHFLGFRLERKPDGQVEVHLSQRTVDRLKLRIGELTPRSWGQPLKTCFEGLNEYLRGWFAYFRICTQKGADLFRVFDAHIRRRIRAIIIHQKRRNRFLLRALLARGVSRRAATGTAWSRRGTWHRSNRPGMTRAYPNPWFRARMFSLSDAWLRLHAVQLVSGQLSLFDHEELIPKSRM